MAGTNRRGGILYLTINGRNHTAKGDFEYMPSGLEREGLVGANEIAGFKAKPRQPYIKGTITDRGDLDIAELDAMENGSAVLGLGTGKAFRLTGAFTNIAKMTTEEGDIQIELYGMAGEVVTAA